MDKPITPTYQDKTREILRKIIYTHNLHNEETPILRLFDLLTSECLSYPTTETLPPFSLICTDGMPIQFSVSLGKTERNPRELRYVTEICKPTMTLPERVNLTRKRIPLLLETIQAQSLQPTIDKIIAVVLPTPHLSPDYPKFGIWTGVQHSADKETTLKLYLNLLTQIGNPWTLFHDALKKVEGQTGKILLIRELLGSSCHPNSMGIECSAHGIGRVKLYLRGYDLSPTKTQGLLGHLKLHEYETALTEFHDTFQIEDKYPPFSTIISIGILENETQDMKLEIGPSYYAADDEDTIQLVTDLAHKLDLDITPYKQMINLLSEFKLSKGLMQYNEVIGIGFHSENGVRITTYMKPNLAKLHGHGA